MDCMSIRIVELNLTILSFIKHKTLTGMVGIFATALIIPPEHNTGFFSD